MCGIFGILNISENNRSDFSTICDNVTEVMHHRGPDDHGVFVTHNLAFLHLRLSILDLSPLGHQPMIDTDSGVVIVYNGEVYNFLELKKELQALGIRFQSTTDTEVILKAYAVWGVAVFSRLDGMFAFAIYDPRIEKIIVVRDFAGIKPLYYYHDFHKFAFSSELKGLKAAKLDVGHIDYQGFSEYLWYGNTISDHTMHASVKKLLPGNYIVVDVKKNKLEITSYWKITDYLNQSRLSEKDTIRQVRDVLEFSVKQQLMSDVPVGVCLSGGIDSSAVTAFASRYYPGKLKTFSVDFDFMEGGSELPNARLIAETFQTDHHELRISSGDIAQHVIHSLDWHDEPFADAANLPLFLISKELRQFGVKVVLQGDGGDELFAGYRRYNTIKHRQLWKAIALFKPFLSVMPQNDRWDRRKRFLEAISHSDPAMMHALLLTVESLQKSPMRVCDPDIQAKLAQTNPFASYHNAYAQFKSLDDVQRMLAMDYQILLQHDFLEKVDKPTMANSVEVRVPFLSKSLVELALSIPSNYKIKGFEKKYLLKKALDGIVPNSILYGPKKGFGVPYQHWLKTELNPMLQQSLDYLCRNKFIQKQIVTEMVDHHVSGKQDNGFILWKLMLFGLWVEKNHLKK